MGAKHTPGPWTFGIRRDDTAWLSIGDPRRGPHNQFDWEGRKEDLPLLTAAPDMLSTERKLAAEVGGLRAFEHQIRSIIGNTNWSLLMQRLAEADAAIAKAEGRS